MVVDRAGCIPACIFNVANVTRLHVPGRHFELVSGHTAQLFCESDSTLRPRCLHSEQAADSAVAAKERLHRSGLLIDRLI